MYSNLDVLRLMKALKAIVPFGHLFRTRHIAVPESNAIQKAEVVLSTGQPGEAAIATEAAMVLRAEERRLYL